MLHTHIETYTGAMDSYGTVLPHCHMSSGGKRVNAWIRAENIETAKAVGSLSEFLNDKLKEEGRRRQKEASESESSKKISMVRDRLTDLQHLKEDLEKEIAAKDAEKQALSYEILDTEKKLQEEISKVEFRLDREDFLAKAFANGEKCVNQKQFFGNIRNKTSYQFDRMENDKIFILNCNTGRRNSSFGVGTLESAMQDLEDGNGRVPHGGGLIAVKMHEEALVSLHPDLWVRDGEIVYDRDFVESVDYIHCKMCGEEDHASQFPEIRSSGYNPDSEPILMGHYCENCGHRTHLDHDFPDIDEYYPDMQDHQDENRMDDLRMESKL